MFVYPVSESCLSDLLSNSRIASQFSNHRMLERFLIYEKALVQSQADAGLVSCEAKNAILSALAEFEPDTAQLTAGSTRDGMAVPDFVCQVKAQLDDRYKGSFHLGSTSQDLIDSALAMALAEINSEWQTSFEELLAELGQLDAEFGGIRTIARTRMQDALPITLSLRVQTWVQPLIELRDQLEIIRPNVEVIQFGGPVGDRRSFGEKADAVSRGLAARLHLRDPGRAWHNQRANLATYAAWLTSATGVLGKIGTDCALMAQMGEVWFSEAGNSSAMPHKSNPVAAEILITLARFNATLAAGMHGAVIHEQERSGSSWTLEWMLLPQMCVATGASTNAARKMLQSMQFTV